MPIPHAFLLAAVLLVSAGPRTLFTDVTGKSGIPPIKYAEGVNICDLDGDGLPEIFLPDVKGRDRLYRNLGGCRFEDVTDRRGVKEKGGIGGVLGDLDNDGLADLYVVRGAYPYGMNVLYRQRADGTFEDVTESAGAASGKNGISAVMLDMDGDGFLDIFVSNWGVNTLYRNKTGENAWPVAFEDVTKKAGLAEGGRSWGAVAGDFSGDGLPDIFVSRGGFEKGEDSKLYINKGGGMFEDATAKSGIKGVSWSMGAIACDFDGDGSLDLFVTSYDGPDQLYINDGKGRFTNATAGSGITSMRDVGSASGDIDGDGVPDIVVAGFRGPVRVFKGLGGAKFREVTADAGLRPYKRNEGVALADFDGDGDLDLYVANYDGHNALYRNELAPGPYIKVRPLDGKRAAIGAVVRLYKAGGVGDPQSLIMRQDVQAGYGFCSQSPPEALFRLPDKGPYDLTVTFPGGETVANKGVTPGVIVVSRPETH